MNQPVNEPLYTVVLTSSQISAVVTVLRAAAEIRCVEHDPLKDAINSFERSVESHDGD